MLDLAEKVVLALGGLMVLLTLGLYLGCYSYIGLPTGVPSTDSVDFLPKVRKKPVVETPPPAAATQAAPPGPSSEEQAILQKLKEQSVTLMPGQRLQQELMEVPVVLFEKASNEANWTEELKKAQSQVLSSVRGERGETRLKVRNVAENSLLKSFGIQENDVIELIDGEIVQFSQTSTHELYSRAKALFEKARAGGSISVTVTRNNRPVHLTFQLEK